MSKPYCACGRLMSACDGSRAGCESAQERWTAGRRAGAEAMRERVAALLRSPEARELYVLLGPRAIMALANQIADLPLDDDAREDAGLVCGACGTPMSSSAADAVAYSGFPPAEGLSRPSCCDAAYPANAREDAQGHEVNER